jgi:asparagine synthase (glutamine-hydrolysing)
MCGISGIWNYKTGQVVEANRLRLITDLLAHRGPDGEGFYTSKDLGLGHRRLSIIDLEGGKQPMCNEDSSVWIVFNGEIYNYPELREQLLQRGHTLRTKSDTEAIVHLYEDFGEDCFEKLQGMFALALWDERQRKLLLARDRIGIKPLFYGQGNNGLVFASEIKSIVASGLVDLAVDTTAIADLFTFFYIPGPKTIYQNVRSLEPGSYLRVDSRGIFQRKYWDLQEGQLSLASEEEYEQQLLALLRQSVKSHLLSDVPLGAFLSGGVDSSCVVALMKEFATEAVTTCSIGFGEEEYNELPRARFVAKTFSCSHHEQTIDAEPAQFLTEMPRFYDQPFPDHSSLPTYYVSQLARRHVKVVLSGDGGDETFAGYSRYRRQHSLERIRRTVPSAFLYPFRSWAGNRENGALPERLRRALHQASVGARDGYLHGITIADKALRHRIFSSDLNRDLAGYDPLDAFRDLYDRAPGTDFLSRVLYLDLKTYLVDDVLTKVDRASMANSLEVRVPLLDHHLVEFAHSLPLQLKLRDGKGKYLLRKVMRQFLPQDFLDARKMGFRIPFVPWVRESLRNWSEDILFKESQTSSFIDQAALREIWENFQGGHIHLGDLMGIILSFALWSRPANAFNSSALLRGTPDVPTSHVWPQTGPVTPIAL